MKPSTRLRPRAFTLMEMLMALSLLTLFLSVATQIFHSSFKLMESATASDTQAARFDHALAALRRDVWESQRQTVSDHELSLEFPDKRRIVWTASEDEGLSRTEQSAGTTDDERHWPQLTSMNFESAGPTVTLVVIGKWSHERVEMIAPMRLLEAPR
jgi:prepilin-type N-terminal cleavage/methylation domain-containing protein